MQDKATKIISTEQCYTVASYLRTAEGRFKEFVEALKVPPANPRLQEQFEKQAKEAGELASIFEDAEFVEVVFVQE